MSSGQLAVSVAAGLVGLATTACVGVMTTPDTGESASAAGELPNFSWVVDDKLAGMARPGATRTVAEDLADLRTLGIRLLVSLTETSTSAADAKTYDIEVLHIPVQDYTAPSMDQLAQFVDRAGQAMNADRAVAVHCYAGQGRTGTFLAAWFVSQGMAADAAIEEVRRLRPGSIETVEQEQAVRDFETYLAQQNGDRS